MNNSLRPGSVDGFLKALPLVFQLDQSAGLNATFQFTFTGEEQRQVTIEIRGQKICMTDGLVGQPNLRMTADSRTWIGFLRKEKNIVWALLRRKIRIKGSPQLLLSFGKCFPQ